VFISLLLGITVCSTAQTSTNPDRRQNVASLSNVTAEDFVGYCAHLDDSTETDQGIVEKQACTIYIRGFLDGFAHGMVDVEVHFELLIPTLRTKIQDAGPSTPPRFAQDDRAPRSQG
jgi:hypothetical protein